MSTQPQQLAFYKGMSGKWGALQFSLQPGHKVCDTCKAKVFDGLERTCTANGCSGKLLPREGAVFIDASSTISENTYDWTKKITFALSTVDIGKILYGMRTATEGTEVKLMHDPGAKTESMGKVKKYVNFSSPQGPTKGFMISVSEQSGDQVRKHLVPINPEEATILMTLLQAAIPRILSW